jgi:hypothetical protein
MKLMLVVTSAQTQIKKRRFLFASSCPAAIAAGAVDTGDCVIRVPVEVCPAESDMCRQIWGGLTQRGSETRSFTAMAAEL